MAHAIRIHQHGGPEALSWDEITLPEPGPGQVRLRHTAIGLNFIDIYHRTGLYPQTNFPLTLGMEGAGVVEALGEGVTELKVGDRVAYASTPLGAYAEIRLMPAERLVPLPEWISDQQAAAMMLQGMTAQYLLRSTYRIQSGQTILIHAAAGGVGLIACQWAKHLGARVIGTVGSDEKAELAAAHGCDHPIVYTRENFADRVKELTDGKGVPVVYDSVGRTTFKDSLACLAVRGYMVCFGQSSGPIGPIELSVIAPKGNYLVRPSLGQYTGEREDLMGSAAELFEVVHKGVVKVEVRQTFPLREAAEAHRAIEARKTTGSTILLP